MRTITLDFETYYSSEYTLSKLTTEEYIRDPRFEAIMVGIKVDALPAYTVVGADIQPALDSLGIEESACLAHHAQFDGLILSHHFGHRPKVWLDTLSMSRPVCGMEVGGALAKLAMHFGLPPKGTEVSNALGKHLRDFASIDLQRYRNYCEHDVKITYRLYKALLPSFSLPELRQIDMLIRMFTEPVLDIDVPLLTRYANQLRADKVGALLSAGVSIDQVMSNDKFAAALIKLGVTPPVKTSPATKNLTYAFAKTDNGLTELLEHEDERVQMLVAARLGNKSTINETRAERLIAMASRGPAPVYLRYYGAMQTGRVSGGDKMNWQNLSRRSALREAIRAPVGHTLVVCDSSNIEARVLDWLARAEGSLDIYRAYDAGVGPDPYCVLASAIYERPITVDDATERQTGKVAKLGLGYQMGAQRLQLTALTMGVKLSILECERIVSIYRSLNGLVCGLWDRAQTALGYTSGDRPIPATGAFLDPRNLIGIEKYQLKLPNGMYIRYPKLRPTTMRGDYEYWGGKTNEKIYGGKVVENLVQALARIIVMEQTVAIAKRYRVVMSVHDEAVACVPEADAEEAVQFMLATMRTPLHWCPDIPLAAKAGIAVSYGEAK